MPSDSFKHHHSSMLSLNNAFYYGQSRLSKDRRKTRPFFILGDMHYLAFIRQAQQSSIVYRSNANIHILSTNTPPKHPLHNNNNPHPPPNSPTNPQTQLPKQKAPVAKHTTKTCHLQNTFTCSHSTTMALNSFCTCGLTVTCIQQTRCPQASCQKQATNQVPKQNSKQGNRNRR
jgi:hypothetical protein